MSCYKFSFTGCKYESPSCEISDVTVNTALLIDSVGSSTISPYANDANVIDL